MADPEADHPLIRGNGSDADSWVSVCPSAVSGCGYALRSGFTACCVQQSQPAILALRRPGRCSFLLRGVSPRLTALRAEINRPYWLPCISGVGMPPLVLSEDSRRGEVGATIPQIDDGPLWRSKHLPNPEDKNERPEIDLYHTQTPAHIV